MARHVFGRGRGRLTMTMTMTTCALGAVLLAGAAVAHHGFTGAYDTSRPLYLEGRVTAVTLVQPHAEMTIEVPADIALPQDFPQIDVLGIADVPAKIRPMSAGTYRVQMAGTNFVRDLSGRIKPGDRVGLVALRNCRPPNEVRSRWIRTADGAVLVRGGATQAEVNGCPAAR